jgi:hypothetical protein
MFLKLAAAAVIGRALPSWPLAVFAAPGPLRLDDVSVDVFRPHVHSTFVTAAGPLTLEEISERPMQPGIAQFSLLFRGRRGEQAQAGTYVFNHAALGRFDIYITPVGVPGERAVYEACFSRHVDERRESTGLRA